MSAQHHDPKREFFPQLTSVRFFAAFIVVCYHYKKELGPHLPSLLHNIINHGYVGVSFFFILSGFILGANYYDRLLTHKVSRADFWWARFSRSYPVYLLSILVFLPRFLLSVNNDPIPDQAVYAHAHPVATVLSSVFLLQTFATPGSGFLNSPTWSISTEVFFYLLLPYLIPLLAKLKSNRLLPAMVVLFLVAGIGPLCYHANVFPISFGVFHKTYTHEIDYFFNQFIYMSFLTRLPEFLIGVLAFRLYKEVLRTEDLKRVLGIGALASVPFILTLLFEGEGSIGHTILYSSQFISIPFFLTVVLGLIMERSKPLDFLKSPFWVLMGEASFSLYLFHVPIKNFGQYILAKLLHVEKSSLPLCLFLMAVSVLISIPIFNFIETPTRKRLTTWWKKRRSVAPASA